MDRVGCGAIEWSVLSIHPSIHTRPCTTHLGQAVAHNHCKPSAALLQLLSSMSIFLCDYCDSVFVELPSRRPLLLRSEGRKKDTATEKASCMKMDRRSSTTITRSSIVTRIILALAFSLSPCDFSDPATRRAQHCDIPPRVMPDFGDRGT